MKVHQHFDPTREQAVFTVTIDSPELAKVSQRVAARYKQSWHMEPRLTPQEILKILVAISADLDRAAAHTQTEFNPLTHEQTK